MLLPQDPVEGCESHTFHPSIHTLYSQKVLQKQCTCFKAVTGLDGAFHFSDVYTDSSIHGKERDSDTTAVLKFLFSLLMLKRPCSNMFSIWDEWKRNDASHLFC